MGLYEEVGEILSRGFGILSDWSRLLIGAFGVILKILLTRPPEVADNNLAETMWFGFVT